MSGVLQTLPSASVEPTGRIVVGRSTRISADAPTIPHAETFLALNPINPRQMLATSIVYDSGAATSVVYGTQNGGGTWTRTTSGPGVPVVAGADPIVDFETTGAALFGAISSHPAGFQVWRSIDAGVTWSSTTRVPGGVYDRPYMAVDRSASHTHGRLHIAGVVVLDKGNGDRSSVIGTTYSEDGGRTFAPTVLVDPASTVQGGLGGVADLIVTTRGEVIVPFVGGTRIWTLLSTDGGRTYSAPRAGPPIGRGSGFRALKTLSSRRAVMDLSTGPFADRLYMTWVDFADDHYDVKVAHSDDAGATWSYPVRVNDNTGPNDPANPAIAVNRDGIVLVTFNDRRDDPHNECFRLYAAASLDGGESFLPNVPVSAQATCTHASGNWPGAVAVNLQRDRDTQQWMHLVRLSGVPERFPNGGETQGLVAGPDGRFHAAWINGASGVMQLWYSELRVEAFTPPARQITRDYSTAVEIVGHTPRVNFEDHRVSFTVGLRNQTDHVLRGPLVLRLERVDGGLPGLAAVNSDNGRPSSGAAWGFVIGRASTLAPGAMSELRELQFRFTGDIPVEPYAGGRFVARFKVFQGNVN